MKLLDTTTMQPKEPLPGWRGRFFNAATMTFVHYEIAADAVALHEHDHPQEEVWHVLEGELALTVESVEHRLRAGHVAIIPPNTRHSARAITTCRAIVVDHPRRDTVGRIPIED